MTHAASVKVVLPYGGIFPHFAAPPQHCGMHAAVLGRVSIGAHAHLGNHSVIRGDGQIVRIGDDFHLGEFSTVHIAHEIYPTIIGSGVSVGCNAVVHACTVGDECVVEDDAVILDGSVVDSGVVIAAGSVVFPRSTLKSGSLYLGSPARPLRSLESDELIRRGTKLRNETMERARAAATGFLNLEAAQDAFIAQSAILGGRIKLEAQASVYFSCFLDAGQGTIVIGARTNVQDNTTIQCNRQDVVIGRDTTIGHNVRLNSCRVGNRAMVGIGTVVSAGTRIDDDVLLAAGSTTNADQHLEGGWLWGGRPARPIAKLNESRRSMLMQSIDQYCTYSRNFKDVQEAPRS
jgi:carbonic anhydrase/acetyltransferase-like protein (isoleucine patch superfamily)